MKIENTILTKEHIGRKVAYVPKHAELDFYEMIVQQSDMDESHPDIEHGIISSFTDTAIFVRYTEGDTGANTPPKRLRWL